MTCKPTYHPSTYDIFPATGGLFQTHMIAKEILKPIQEKSVMYLESLEATTEIQGSNLTDIGPTPAPTQSPPWGIAEL